MRLGDVTDSRSAPSAEVGLNSSRISNWVGGPGAGPPPLEMDLLTLGPPCRVFAGDGGFCVVDEARPVGFGMNRGDQGANHRQLMGGLGVALGQSGVLLDLQPGDRGRGACRP